MEGKLVLTTAALAAFALFAPACSQGDRNVIQWIDGVGSSPGELGVLPAGYESHVIHSCRVRVGNDVAAGKLYYTTNCEYVYNGGHAQSGNYELLYAAPGTTSWVPYTGSVDMNTVVGGHVSRNYRYVCRAFIGDDDYLALVPGELDQDTKKCHFYHDGGPREATSNFDILVRNKYGQVMNTTIYE